MPSTDIDGSPLLILSLEDAEKLKVIFDYFSVTDDENMCPLVDKVDKFLDEVKAS